MEEGKCPDAIVCANDYMAMAVIDELYKRNLSVPQDVIVTGYDGSKSGMIYSPSVTTAVSYTHLSILRIQPGYGSKRSGYDRTGRSCAVSGK